MTRRTRYLEVDLEGVHRVLNEQLREFSEFVGFVERYLEANPDA